MKSRGDRFDQVIEYVRTKFGNNPAIIVDRNIDYLPVPSRKSIGDALSIPSSVNGSEKRNAIRTLLYLNFAKGTSPALANALRSRFENYSLQQLENEVKASLPLFDKSPKRDAWDPANFTDVDQTGHAPRRFKYIVFGMMNTHTGRGTSFKRILAKPDVLKTFAISSSVIDQDHRSTYYPYGFILRVPKNCVLSTNPKDQAFKNYRAAGADGGLSPVELTDLTPEVRRVVAAFPIRTPDEVLAGTSGREGNIGYNEVVLLGTAPGGETVQPVGFFMKVDSAGHRFEFKKNEGPPGKFVTGTILRKMRATGLPIVRITDSSGKNG